MIKIKDVTLEEVEKLKNRLSSLDYTVMVGQYAKNHKMARLYIAVIEKIKQGGYNEPS